MSVDLILSDPTLAASVAGLGFGARAVWRAAGSSVEWRKTRGAKEQWPETVTDERVAATAGRAKTDIAMIPVALFAWPVVAVAGAVRFVRDLTRDANRAPRAIEPGESAGETADGMPVLQDRPLAVAGEVSR